MRMMIDLLLFHLISRISVMLAVCMAIMKSMAPGKPTLNIVSIIKNQLKFCSLEIPGNFQNQKKSVIPAQLGEIL